MGLYQGRALRQEARKTRRTGRLRRVVRVFMLLLAVVALAHVPWDSLRSRFAVLTRIDVHGLRYLEADVVRGLSELNVGDDLFAIDLDRTRQTLLMHPRVGEAKVTRRWLRGIRLHIVERAPVLLVQHDVPWEIDSSGVLLEPLAEGVVADVPLLSGMQCEDMPPGTQVHTMEVKRGLAWMRMLSRHDLQLSGRVSEIDVSQERLTGIVLTGGTRVLADAWPPDVRRLSALRVVLADLERSGTLAEEVDIRFENQVIVRPVEVPAGGGDARRT